MISYSLSETAALVTKAARGAGLGWGMAQETAFAVVWLERHGLPGLKVFAKWCTNLDGIDRDEVNPNAENLLGFGPLAADMRWIPGTAGNIPLDNASARVRVPLLMVPFVARMAEAVGQPLAISWTKAEIIVQVDQFEVIEAGGLETIAIDRANIGPTAFRGGQSGPTRTRCLIADETLARLNPFIQRTYVPDSAESRARGAG